MAGQGRQRGGARARDRRGAGVPRCPAYDPNAFAAGHHAPPLWARLRARPREAAHEPRRSRASTRRAARSRSSMAMAALQEGVITPSSTASTARATSRSTTPSSAATSRRATAPSTCSTALALSCNVYFYHVGVRLEIERHRPLLEDAGPGPARPASTCPTRPPACSRARSGSCAPEGALVPGRDGLGRHRPGPGAR